MLMYMKMAHNLEEADNLIRHVDFLYPFYMQGHVRVGADLVTDPAYLVTRTMEDYVTWVDTSKIKKHIMKYNDKLDDFDLLGEQQLYFVISFVCCSSLLFSSNDNPPKATGVFG